MPKERNFHIFYQLLRGADDFMINKYYLNGLEKDNMSNLGYLNKSKCYSTNSINEVKDF
jgi:myosin heavy subunit